MKGKGRAGPLRAARGAAAAFTPFFSLGHRPPHAQSLTSGTSSPPSPSRQQPKKLKKQNSGTFLATALNLIVAAATKADPWINDNSLYGHYDYYYYLNAAILFVAFCIYVPVSRAYIERPIVGARNDEEEEEAEAAEALKAAAVAANKKRFEDKVGAHLNPEDNAVISLDKK